MAEVLDALILVWLIGTWFYEGHHRQCQVKTICERCRAKERVHCDASMH